LAVEDEVRIELLSEEHAERVLQFELDNRVAERVQGRGPATRAVGEVLRRAEEEGISSIRARTTADNQASRHVLERHHFVKSDGDDVAPGGPGRRGQFVHYVWSPRAAGQEVAD
jgi:L-amino acid N-acyltransferase YncA